MAVSLTSLKLRTSWVDYLKEISCVKTRTTGISRWALIRLWLAPRLRATHPHLGVKRAIDEGPIPGPRIYPSEIGLSQYSGHIDFRNPNYPPKQRGGPLDPIEQIGFAYLVNSPDEVRMVVRHNLYKGATQIKMAASGSVSGIADPLYVLEFTEKEIEAAVQAAEDFGTYVQVHAHNAAAIKRALKAGVKTIEFRAKNSMVFT